MSQPRPPATRRLQQKARTRALILESARNQFEEKGFDKTTLRDVATAAGVGLGTIFTHFPGKPALLAAAFHDELEKVLAHALETVPEGPVCDQFLHLAGAFYRNYGRRPALSRVLLKEVLFVSGECGKPLDGQLSRFLTLVTHLLTDARDQGELRPETDCNLAAMVFFSHYLSVLLLHFKAPAFDPEAALMTLGRTLQVTMDGIGRRNLSTSDAPTPKPKG